MAWIESHQKIWRHPKTKKLARLLDTSVPATVGHLHGLWYWALDFSPDGDLSKYDPEEIADAVLWTGDARQFVDALVSSGYADRTESGIVIHDWFDYAGRIIEKEETRKAKTRERVRNYRERQKNSGNAAVTTGNAPTNHTNQPDQTIPVPTMPVPTEPNGTAETRFAVLWEEYPKKVAQKAAWQAFKRLNPDAALFERMMQAIAQAKKSAEWLRENGRYIPKPENWIKDGRWNDEIKEVSDAGTSAQDDTTGRSPIYGFKPAD